MEPIYKICQKCQRSVIPSDRFAYEKSKTWLIKYCPKCEFNFDIEDVTDAPPKRKVNWLKSKFRGGPDADGE